MQTNVNESSEVNYVFDFACHLHSDSQILKLNDAFLHDWSRVSVAWVAVGLSKLFDDVVQSCLTDVVFFDECFFCISRNLFSALYEIQDFTGNVIVLRVNPSVVERVRAFCDFQEACALLECLWSKSWNFFELFTACDFAVLVTVSNDFLCCAHVDSRNVFQEHVACCVKVYADLVNDRANDLIKLLGKLFLVYVMLIKANADCLRVDFYKLCEWVLQTAAH